jgi:hypothetical protein
MEESEYIASELCYKPKKKQRVEIRNQRNSQKMF